MSVGEGPVGMGKVWLPHVRAWLAENRVAGTLRARPTWAAVNGKRASLDTKVVSTCSADVSRPADEDAHGSWPAAEPITEKRTESRRGPLLARRRRLFGPARTTRQPVVLSRESLDSHLTVCRSR